jgi:hypothetical protein
VSFRYFVRAVELPIVLGTKFGSDALHCADLEEQHKKRDGRQHADRDIARTKRHREAHQKYARSQRTHGLAGQHVVEMRRRAGSSTASKSRFPSDFSP